MVCCSPRTMKSDFIIVVFLLNKIEGFTFTVWSGKFVLTMTNSIKTSRAVAKTWLIYLSSAEGEAHQFSENKYPGTRWIVSILLLLPFSAMYFCKYSFHLVKRLEVISDCMMLGPGNRLAVQKEFCEQLSCNID